MRDDNPYELFKHRYLPATSLFLKKLNYLGILLIIGSSGSRFGVLKNQSRVSMSRPTSIEWLHFYHVYSMWSLVRASPRCPWSTTFSKMMKYFVEKKSNERYRHLRISILLYDEVSAFLLWVKTQN